MGKEGELPGFDVGLSLNLNNLDAWQRYLKKRGCRVGGKAKKMLKPEGGRIGGPAPFDEESSQTAFLTKTAIEAIERAEPGWFVHLSYLRPHPPFVAPAPYHALYDPGDVGLPKRAATRAAEAATHPWLAYELDRTARQMDSLSNARGEGADYERHRRQHVATYYGLISKLDRWIGHLLDVLRRRGLYDQTLIVLTSDHGELAGDHWLFGKSGWFDQSFHVPLIIRDPDMPAKRRGRPVDAFSESIDILPTVLSWIGGPPPRQCQGASLLPWLGGRPPADWRDAVHMEYDFRETGADVVAQPLGLGFDRCNLNVVRTDRYKYVHFADLPPLLFDLAEDPAECRKPHRRSGAAIGPNRDVGAHGELAASQ